MLSKVLMNKQFYHPGMPANYLPPTVSNMSSSSSATESDVSSIVLALRTLGSFNFDGKCFCNSCKYLHFSQLLPSLYLSLNIPAHTFSSSLRLLKKTCYPTVNFKTHNNNMFTFPNNTDHLPYVLCSTPGIVCL